MSNIRGSGLKMDIAPQYIKSGFAPENSPSPERRAKNDDVNMTLDQSQNKYTKSQNAPERKQLNTVTLQHMGDLDPNRKKRA